MKGIDQRIAELPPDQLALLLERLAQRGSAAPRPPGPPALRPRHRDGRARPLSFAQERLWFLDQLASAGDYNVPAALRLRGPVDHRAFARGVNEILRRHEVLRAAFVTVAGKPVQVLAEGVRLTPARVDLGGLAAADREVEARRLARLEAREPFDLSRAPLLRVCWLDLAPDDRILLFTLHHIVCDGWSVGILTGELIALYRAFQAGQASPLADLRVQYADYADWQRERLAGERMERLRGYWQRQLKGAPARIDVPGALPASCGREHRGADETFALSPRVSAALASLGRGELTTHFTVLAALFSALLYTVSGQEDLCIGANTAHRGVPDAEGLVGFFVNQVVLRVRPTGPASFRALLREVREVAEAAFEHQDLPFESLVEALCPERSASGNPLFQVKVDFHEERAPLRWPGVEVSELSAVPTPLRCDLLLIGASVDGRIDCTLSYDSGRFRSETVQRMARALVWIAGVVSGEPDVSLAELTARHRREAERQRAAERERLDRIGVTKLRSARRRSALA